MTQKFSCPAMLFWIAMLMSPLAARAQVVTTNADSGPGSLRDAIIFANANPGATITFSFADTAVQTITLLSDLPDIFGDGTVIDGYTKSNADPNTLATGSNAKIGIEITGSQIRCLDITGDNVTVRGLSLYNNINAGIIVSGDSVAIEGCFIGVRADGTGGGNIVQTYGINLTGGGTGGRIGGSLPAQRNVISGNGDGTDGRGIVVQRDDVFIVGNIIGPAPSGFSPLIIAPVQPFGILVQGGSNLRIGGAGLGEGNVVSSNGDGIIIESYPQPAIAPRIQGNLIGLEARGIEALLLLNGVDPQFYGIKSGLRTVQIGGAGLGEGNVISGNKHGIRIESLVADTASATIEGNIIGPQKDGVSPVKDGAQQIGIWAIAAGAGTITGLTIGTENSGGKNTIAYNNNYGIELAEGSAQRINGTRLLVNSIYDNGTGSAAEGINLVSFRGVAVLTTIDAVSPASISGQAGTGDTVRVYTGKDGQGRSYLGRVVADVSGLWVLIGNFSLSTFVTIVIQNSELPRFSAPFSVTPGTPSWTNSNAGIAPGALLAVVSTPSLVIASSANGNIYLSPDGGQNWNAVPPLPIAPTDTLYSMALPRGAALRKGNAAASTNGFGSAVAVGVGGTILRSADASAWSLVSSNTTASLYGVAVSPDFSTVAAKGNGVSATQGFGSAVAVGVGGTILRSADGGTSWQSVSSSNTSTLLSVAVASNFSGAASKSNGSQSVSGLGSAIVVGVGGTILRSADGGTNWQSISSNVSAALNSISLSTDFSTVAAKGNGVSATQGFGSAVAVGVGGTILRSADGGANWVNVSSSVTNLDNITAPLTTDLLSVEFVDETIGYACGKNGVILQTNDGGLSWRQQPSGTTADINDIAVSANGTGNAVGSGTTALITNNGGNPVLSVSAPGAPVPPGFALRQNYPNPFNPNTLISYQLSMNSQVQLKVYDVLGREVASLVDARQATGDYLVNFNATKLSSGVYFYRLTTGNFVQTKKMLLLK